MTDADFIYRNYVSQIEGKINDNNVFTTLDKIGLVNTDDDEGLIETAQNNVSEAKGEVREQLGNMFAKLMIKNPKPAQEEVTNNMVPVIKGAQKRNDKNK